jgi:hypothetical protein
MAQQFDITQSLFGFSPTDVQRQITSEQQQTAMGLASGVPGGLGPAAFQAFRAQERGRGTPLFSSQRDPRLQESEAMQEARQAAQPAFQQGGLVGYLNQYALELEKRGLVDKAVQARSVAAQKEQEAMKTGADVMFKTAQAQKMLQPQPQKPVQIDLGDRVELRDPVTGAVIESIRKGATPGQAAKPVPTTEGQKTLDRDFAKEYSDYVAGGGSSQVDKILQDLKKVEDLLASDKNITGIKVSAADALGTLSALYPDAATAKDLAGGVIQSNLRAILGGQFAQKEGEALLARAYNPAQPQKDNLSRIKNLRKQIETAATAKRRAVEYWEANEGTLAGFKGDLGKAKPTGSAASTAGGVPAGVDPAVWNVMTPEEKALWQ